MGILLFELFRNPLFMGILNKWETLVSEPADAEAVKQELKCRGLVTTQHPPV